MSEAVTNDSECLLSNKMRVRCVNLRCVRILAGAMGQGVRQSREK